ncbi:putative Axonemal dynein light chain [Capsicum annuum]|nr:putative Axonemal dynein light chain [Capsicum annuum]
MDDQPAAAEMLPRSEISFRRQGSSGLIWDDKLLSGELKKIDNNQDDNAKKKEKKSSEPRPIKSRATDNYMQPSIDPPSPKVSGCGICGIFGKPVDKSQKPKKKVKSDGAGEVADGSYDGEDERREMVAVQVVTGFTISLEEPAGLLVVDSPQLAEAGSIGVFVVSVTTVGGGAGR